MAQEGKSPELLVEMRGIVKHFPGVLANDGVNFELRSGEVHALLGENGAGKSTLMNILSGLYKPDAGEIFIESRRHEFGSAREALRAGIGMVHQHFCLVDVFSVAENVTLGMPTPRVALDMREVEREVAELGKKYNLGVDPHARIWQLSVGEQQRVEILKLLYRHAKVLILDEPTSVLTPQESEELCETLRRMASSGRGILFISHKLQEVLAIADRITVLRQSKNVATVDRGQVDEWALAKLMLGEDVSPLVQVDRSKIPGEVRLRVKGLSATSDRGLPAVIGATFEVHAGSILGLAGVAGNGQRELAECIAGLRRIDAGEVWVDGETVTGASARVIINAGLSLIPEDRKGTGLVPELGVHENAILRGYWEKKFSRGPLLDWEAVTEHAQRLVREFKVQTPGLEEQVWKLSGGNQQRLLLAREMTAEPTVIVANHPTSGLDVQAMTDVQNLLLRQRDCSAAILLISEDLDELLALSDKIAVMFEGRVTEPMSATGADRETLGLLMMGAGTEARER